jgi:hypothetical protein
MKNFHRHEDPVVVEEAPPPHVNEHELAEIALSNNDMQLISNLGRELETDPKADELKVMVLRTFEKQLRLAEWRRRNGFPLCELCHSPVARLFHKGDHKVCFNCSVAE